MDLDSFLVSLYVLVDDRWQHDHGGRTPRRTGRPVRLSDPEVLTLAILSQWPRFRSERDFWRFAAYTCAQRINGSLGRPLRHLADLLI